MIFDPCCGCGVDCADEVTEKPSCSIAITQGFLPNGGGGACLLHTCSVCCCLFIHRNTLFPLQGIPSLVPRPQMSSSTYLMSFATVACYHSQDQFLSLKFCSSDWPPQLTSISQHTTNKLLVWCERSRRLDLRGTSTSSRSVFLLPHVEEPLRS